MNDVTSRYSANVWKFYLYRFVRFPLLWAPIYVVFLQESRGYSLAEIGWMDTIFWLSIALAEVPTGIVADRYGRKNSILLGTIVYIVGVLMVSFGQSFVFLAAGFIVWGIAITLASGADEALVFESLRLSGRVDEYETVASRTELFTELSQVFGAAAGGLLALISLVMPFYVSAVLGFFTIFLVMWLYDPPAPVDADKVRKNTSGVLGEVLRLLREQPNLLRTILYLSIITVPPIAIGFVYIQPYILDLGWTLGALGFTLMVMRLASVGGVVIAPMLAQRFGSDRVLAAIPVLMIGVLFLLIGDPSIMGLVWILILGALAAIAYPLVINIVQRKITDEIRATVISLQSLMYTLFSAIMAPIYGALADRFGLSSVFVASIVILVAYLALDQASRLWTARRISQP